MNGNLSIPDVLRRFSRILEEHDFKCFLVGGAIRDLIAGRPGGDYDIATDATPEQVREIYRRVIPTGIEHGTVTVLFDNYRLEVTTFRVDSKYSDGRRPDAVEYTPSIQEDLKRRDFTINSIAYDLQKKRLLDPNHGIDDLKNKLIRAIGNPVARFQEDGLRLLRACRFAAQLHFHIEEATRSAIKHTSSAISNISWERIRDEITKIILSDNLVYGFDLMADNGLLQRVLPELFKCRGIPQGDRHAYDVYRHSLETCAAAPSVDLSLRLAGLFHDVGKAVTFSQEDRPRFHGHDLVSADIAKSIAERLKFPGAVITKVYHLIRHHMFNYTEDWTDAAVRRFVSRVGRSEIGDLVRLRIADQQGMGRKKGQSRYLVDFLTRIESTLQRDSALSVNDLKINGRDIIEKLELSPGPVIGTILRFLLESVLDDPELNEPEILLHMAERFYEERLRQIDSSR